MNWNFELIYKNKNEYQNDFNFIKTNIEKIASFQGKLNDFKCLKSLLELNEEIDIKLSKVFTYANMNFDLNQKNIEALNEYQLVYSLYMQLISASSYIDSELISLGKDTLLTFIDEDKSLTKYRYMIEKLFANEKHVLSSDKELLLSHFNNPLSNYNDLYDKLAVSDNNSVKVILSTGEEVEISNANYTSYLGNLKDATDRQKVFEAVYKYYDSHKNTFAAIYKGIIESDIATMKARGYDSILSSFLEHNKIPNDVFLKLVETCESNTAPVKRYLDLRKKYFNLEQYHTYDRFLELSNFSKKYSYEEGKELFFESVKELGGEFETKAHQVLESGRVDVNIQDGKRTGAYSTGTYQEGPFILLNYTNMLDDVFTLAHEAGHSMHTMYANENQPYVTANYTIFVAEVASTYNEQLLLDYLLKKSDDKELKLAMLQNAIDGLIATFYRQTLFASYEYQAHNLAINNQPITCDSLSNIMKNLYQTYYGIDLNNEPYKEFVWCYIPHLYHTPFYVYQYATSFATSLAIYEKVKNHEENAFENYLNLLKAGGSDFPVELIKKAGVDLTNEKAFLAVVKRLEFLVNELEKLL